MSDQIFQFAFERVRARYTEEQWLALNPRQIIDAIYREIRQIDTERAGSSAADGTDGSAGDA